MDPVIVTTLIVGSIAGLLVKIVFDWLKNNNNNNNNNNNQLNNNKLSESEYYMTSHHCQTLRSECGSSGLKEAFLTHQAETNIKLENMEKRLNEGRIEFVTIRENMGSINEKLAAILTVLEMGKDD